MGEVGRCSEVTVESSRSFWGWQDPGLRRWGREVLGGELPYQGLRMETGEFVGCSAVGHGVLGGGCWG